MLLLDPPYVKNFVRSARWAVASISASNWYPVYLGYATGLLEREGHTAKLVDAPASGLTREGTIRLANAFKPELIVLYFSSKSLSNDLEVADELIASTGAQLVMVGPWASGDPLSPLKQSNVEMVAVGEFDFTVLDLASGIPKPQVNGLVWKDEQAQVHMNESRPPVTPEELEKFPFVTDVYRRHLDLRDYFQTGFGYPFIDMLTGRGCQWGLCTFCLWPFTLNKGLPGRERDWRYRKRSVENVIKELRFVQKEIPQVKQVFFQDDVLPKERIQEISNAILSEEMELNWACYSRANLDRNTLALMRRAGCNAIHVGFESGNVEILQGMQKGISPRLGMEFAKTASSLGLSITADFIVGMPGENAKTIKETIEWAKKLPADRYTFTEVKPYPGTPLYSYLVENGYYHDGRVDYPDFSFEDILNWNRQAAREIYTSREYLLRMAKKPHEWMRLAKAARYGIPYVLKKPKPEERAAQVGR